MNPEASACRLIAAWTTPETKAQFTALAISRGLSQSKLLGLVLDSLLSRNQVAVRPQQRSNGSRDEDRITVRLRPGDGRLLRRRAQARNMNYTTYAAALIRSHLRANAPLPLAELARLERSLSEVTVIARRLGEIARQFRQAADDGRGVSLDLASAVEAVRQLREDVREVVKANVISWESDDAEAHS